jgi:hypothetical protein
MEENMAKSKRRAKSTRPKKRKTSAEIVDPQIQGDGSVKGYVYSEPEIVEPKIKGYGGMYKDAGAGIVKFTKVTASRDNKNVCMLKIKIGMLGHRLNTEEEGPFEDFKTACQRAEEYIEQAKVRGYKFK